MGLGDHLGNVLATVLDRKTGQIASVPTLYDHYLADVETAQDYYPFGMPMPGRTINGESSRFGFAKGEKINEIAGIGNHVDIGERGLDTRIGRLNWRPDPLAKKFPWNSPYTYAENDVIRCIDLDGLEKVAVFGGADLMNTGLSKTTLQTAANIKKYSDDHNLGYDVKTFNVAPWNPSHGTAFDWIKNNYKKAKV